MSYRADKLVIDTHTHIHTHGHTDPQTQAMTIPEGQNWPRVKNGEASWEINETLLFGGLFITYIMSLPILLFRVRLGCLSIFMYIWITYVCNDITTTHTDICVCINIHIDSRYISGRLWVRVPPGVSYFPKSFDCFKKTFSWKWVLFPSHDWQFIC